MHFFDRIATLEREQASFAIATVVARRSPVSSHLGDRALVFADGRMEGFVGGSCSRDIVRRQALGAIRNRQPVLLQIRNAASDEAATSDAAVAGFPAADSGAADAPESSHADRTGNMVSTTERVVIPMSCASEGAVDVYIEPRVPLRRLIVIGFTPVADALAQIGSSLDYNVVRVVADDERRDLGEITGARVLALAGLRAYLEALDQSERATLVAIVASQGHYDELALEALLPYSIAFIGLLASRRRAATVLGVLAQQGVAADLLAMIRHPVGLDIGARSPGEVAVSILAEIIANAPAAVARANARSALGDATDRSLSASATAIDPVCGMDVTLAGALYSLSHDGQMYFFCCASCRASFGADPAPYLVALGNA